MRFFIFEGDQPKGFEPQSTFRHMPLSPFGTRICSTAQAESLRMELREERDRIKETAKVGTGLEVNLRVGEEEPLINARVRPSTLRPLKNMNRGRALAVSRPGCPGNHGTLCFRQTGETEE